MKLPKAFLIHEVTVRPKAGESSVGTVYGDPFTLRCMAQGKRRLVRNSVGQQVLSDLTLWALPGQAETIPVGSEVTWRGATTTVITSTEWDSGNLGAPDHTEVACGSGMQ